MSSHSRLALSSVRPLALRPATAAAAAVLVAIAIPRLAGTQPGGRHSSATRPTAAAPERTPADALPGPFALSLFAAVLSGVAGAAAAERIGGGRGAAPAASAALEKLVVGSVSAVALLGLNPPDGAWTALAGTAAVGGIAGQALLAAAEGARRVQAAELARDAADEGARRVALLAGEQMETLRRLAVDAAGLIGSGTAPDDALERALDGYAGRARVELMRVARREPLPPRAAADHVFEREPA
jgi:hypothetical protein